ncbi:MAG: EpsI family protein [Nitrospirae bacterium CG_4_8_14_3_um_filter_70_85]|nr:EpsI family protein [Deltaproteobacteria bacterium]PIW83209.1 MAG: EpsI family protein [Nitrospirae bacterium CG_4_8_14_3_um_filter_70_85]PIX84409.1 MAG: EpsI family protein [Nitrospirae bacterium CG_4_10_14_3_um_filter_70_108]PJB95671.1 MAG: EpsI family protein [Nitrospirae bacterium CG_4_9_14_0_8_um_filter_70_14]
MRLRLLLACGLVVAVAAWVRFVPFSEVVPPLTPLVELPNRLGAWEGRDHRFEDYVYEQLKVSDSLLREYRRPGASPVYLYVGYYASQREGMQIHSPKHCMPGGGWAPRWARVVEVAEPQLPGGRLTAAETLYGKGDEETLFLYWYQMAHRITTNEYLLKLYMIDHAIRFHRTDAAFVRLSVDVAGGDTQTAAAQLTEFARLCLPELVAFLPR